MEVTERVMAKLKILHVIGQRPEMTGSGIYVEAMIRESRRYGIENYRVAGVPYGKGYHSKHIPQSNCSYVFFESGALDFAVTGMSDVMPYKNSLFKNLKGRRLTAYKAAFRQSLQSAVERFDPGHYAHQPPFPAVGFSPQAVPRPAHGDNLPWHGTQAIQ
jgi:hypothetical protein